MNQNTSDIKDKQKNIVYISPYYNPNVASGANRRFNEICDRFSKQYGDNFYLVVSRGCKPVWWKGKNLLEVNYKFKHSSKITILREISKFLDSLPPSIVIIESIPIPFRALRRHVHFQVAYDFRYFTGDSKGFWYRTFFGSFLKRQWKNSEFMVTPTEFSIDELHKYVGYPRERVVKSFFGIDDNLLNTNYSQNSTKNWDIIYVGHFEKRKNHEPLLDAVSLIDKNLKVLLIGSDNGLQSKLEEQSKRLGLTNVKFDKIHDDELLWQMYSESKIFVFPSIYEGFGIPLIEALALKIPVVCSDIPVFHEVGGTLVTYFNPREPKNMAEKINVRLADGKLPAYEDVRKHLEQFTWENIYKKFDIDIQIFSARNKKLK